MRFRPNAMRMARVEHHMRRGRLFSFKSRCREAEPDGHEGLLVYNACGSPLGREDSGAARSHRSLSPAIGPHSRGSPPPCFVRMIAATIAASFADAGAWYLSDFSRSPLSVRRSAINRPQSP